MIQEFIHHTGGSRRDLLHLCKGPFTPNVSVSIESMLRWCLRHRSHLREWCCSRMDCSPIPGWLYLFPMISMRAISLASSQHWLSVDTDTSYKRALNFHVLCLLLWTTTYVLRSPFQGSNYTWNLTNSILT